MSNIFESNTYHFQELFVVVRQVQQSTTIKTWKCNYNFITNLSFPLHNNSLRLINEECKYNVDKTILSNNNIFNLLYNQPNFKYLNQLYYQLPDFLDLFEEKHNKQNNGLTLLQVKNLLNDVKNNNNLLIFSFSWNNNLKILNKYENKRYNANKTYYSLLEKVPSKILYFVNMSKKTSGIIIRDIDMILLFQLRKLPTLIFNLMRYFNLHKLTNIMNFD